MCPVPYFTMIRSHDHSFDLRLHLVRAALQSGVRAAARQLGTSRNTVRKWLRRSRQSGPDGLRELSRAPKRCPHKTSQKNEQKVLAQRARTPGFGAARLKREFELAPSAGAISRILRQHSLTRRRKRKHQTKRDLRAVKAQFVPLTHFQMDVKYLNDIPHFWPFLTGLRLPGFQYTARCVKTGATFLAYGCEVSLTYAELTARRLLQHLAGHGIDPHSVTIQTDRGSEFDGQTVSQSDRGFTHTIEREFGAHHRLLLKANPNANADVESFHAHEETEFFDIESFTSADDFWYKISTYQNYWNLALTNSYKNHLAPFDILQQSNPHIPLSALLLPPFNLDTISTQGVGHDVPVLTV